MKGRRIDPLLLHDITLLHPLKWRRMVKVQAQKDIIEDQGRPRLNAIEQMHRRKMDGRRKQELLK